MSKGKILVIDDSPLVRKLAEVSLQEAGYEVFTADNGEDGLKIAENVNPDLILVDFIMPKMTGSQFCILLKENEKLK
ncbi:MAG: response regulator, partial [Thermodesulfovibrio sp.]|nr:response regulator [Thermodesulfovibrio sp.]